MNNKRIIKTTSAIALLLSLSLTACGTQDTQLLTATEESMQETATQETEANTETATDTESPLAVFCKYKLPKNAEALPKSCSGKFLKVA